MKIYANGLPDRVYADLLYYLGDLYSLDFLKCMRLHLWSPNLHYYNFKAMQINSMNLTIYLCVSISLPSCSFSMIISTSSLSLYDYRFWIFEYMASKSDLPSSNILYFFYFLIFQYNFIKSKDPVLISFFLHSYFVIQVYHY